MTKSDLLLSNLDTSNKACAWDLRMFLILGCSALRSTKIAAVLQRKSKSEEIPERRKLVSLVHAELEHRIARGDAHSTIINCITAIRAFYRYIDECTDENPTTENVPRLFAKWIDWYRNKTKINNGKQSSVYRTGVTAGSVLASATDICEKTLYRSSGLQRNGSHTAGLLLSKTAKQNISDTFAFGRTLLDITNTYTLSAIRGTLPIVVKFWDGTIYEDYGRYERHLDKSPSPENIARSTFINTRIEAEILIFISQTGMNLSQAWNCKYGDFRFSTLENGLGVRLYKGRKLGEIEFQIFSEYRKHFERYLKFRSELLAQTQSNLLFPLIIRPHHQRPKKITFCALRSRLIRIGKVLIGPQMLRKTRVNWMIRQSNDKSLVAEAHGHSIEVLLDNYETPHHQTAVVEIAQFFSNFDASHISAGPGLCLGSNPDPTVGKPSIAPQPDCLHPDGCLFCQQNRDIDSLDHVWMLMSFRHLKSLEIARSYGIKDDMGTKPAQMTLNRISEKIDWFSKSNEERKKWVEECTLRIAEDNHHPRWAGWITIAERLL